MLKVQLTPRRVLYAELEPDNGTNKGGFYCRVFEDEECAQEKDYGITIRKEEIPQSITDANERRKKAIKLADEKIRKLYK